MRRPRFTPTPRVRFALLAAATLVGAALSTLVFYALPEELDVRTDIVGYPIFANFNIDRYFWAYGAIAGLFPLTTLVLYLGLRRLIAPGPPQPSGVIEALDRRPPPAHGDRVSLAAAAGRIILVGIALGLEVPIGGRWQGVGGIIVASVATGYGLAVVVVAAAFAAGPLRTRDLPSVLAAVNAVLATSTTLGLAWVSRGTQVTVSSNGHVHRYPWFPWWLAIVTIVVVLGFVVRALRRSRAAVAIERRVVLLAVGPVLLFLLLAGLPGAPGSIDSFHEGEQLGAAHLVDSGFFPWRDVLFIHGLLGDVAQPLVGLNVFGDTRWANLAGSAMFAIPLMWIALFLLCAYLFRDNWLFLVLTQVAVVTSWVFAVQPRFVLLPFAILLLMTLLRRPTWTRAIAFTTVLAVQTVATPEGSYMLPAYLAAVVLFDVVHRGEEHGFTRTIRCGITAAVLLVGWTVFLATQHALGDFIYYYRTFAPGHALTGGLTVALGENQAPTLWGGDLYYKFAAATPVLLVLLAFWYFAARARSARSLSVEDWAMGATAVFVGFYYVKFLSRTDHVYHPFAVTLPLFFYAVYRAISAVEAFLSAHRPKWAPPRHFVTLPLLIIVLVTAPTGLLKLVQAAPSHFSAYAPAEPPAQRVGYVLNPKPLFSTVFTAPIAQVSPSLLSDIGTIMHTYVRPGERVFDFSNNPGLFWYLLRLKPATRYFHVSMAIREATQHDLIRELRRETPRLVVFSSDWLGLPFWDGIPNPVRHYDISRYLLDHYRPVLWSHGLLIFRRADVEVAPPSVFAARLVEPVRTNGLYFRTFPCDWGYAPDFLTIHPKGNAQGLTLRPSGTNDDTVLHMPPNLARYGWLEVESGTTFTGGTFELSDRPPSLANKGHTIRFTTRGGTSTIRVQVGSCSQWHGYRDRVLHLRTDPAQTIRAIRLLP